MESTTKPLSVYADEIKAIKSINEVKKLPLKKLVLYIKIASDAYYNSGLPLISDEIFDAMLDQVHKKNPKENVLNLVGAPIESKYKVKLPFILASQDKIKPNTKELDNWISKYKKDFVLSDKLDGVSALFYYKDKKIKLYTRGDGKEGGNISHLLYHINLPKITPKLLTECKELAIRGELVMKESVFQKKYKDKFANARNLVSGIVNQKPESIKKYKNIVKDIDFISYEIIEPRMKTIDQFDILKKLGNSVWYQRAEVIDEQYLIQYFVNRIKCSEYGIDGIVVANNGKYPNSNSKDTRYYKPNGNPRFSVAFKMPLNMQTADVKVEEVEWNASKHGYLKPRIRFKPVKLSGVTITWATGFNAKYIKENKIGKGSTLRIIRSGDVIPFILEVLKPCKKADLPSHLDYYWNETKVDIILENKEGSPAVRVKVIMNFFNKIKTEGMGEGNIKKLVKSKFNSIEKIVKMTPSDFMTIEGFQTKSAKKLHKNIQDSLLKASLEQFMAASNIFGVGWAEKKFKLITKVHPNIMKLSEKYEYYKLVDKIMIIDGFQEKTAKQFAKGLPQFIKFVKNFPVKLKLKSENEEIKKSTSNKNKLIMEGSIVLFTGFRDKDLEKLIEKYGGKVVSGFSKKVTQVIVADLNSTSSKIKAAKESGIPLFTKKTFVKKYFSSLL